MMGIGPKISGGSLSGKLVVEPIDEHTINMAVSLHVKLKSDLTLCCNRFVQKC